jgi:hypothetical protein
MNIEYAVHDTPIGKGLFTLQLITKGTLIWTFLQNTNVEVFDEKACTKHLASLPLAEAQTFLDTSYGLGDNLCLILDDGKYMNHSDDPNCKTDMLTGCTYATRDILRGEQLFEDYRCFTHPDFLYDLLQTYDCAPTYYALPAI